MADNGNLPAYPTEPNTQAGVYRHHGLTKREAFAMAAMQGILSRTDTRPADASRASEDLFTTACARAAAKHADALLAALEAK